MSKIPEDLQYTVEHEYVKSDDEDGVVVVGITDYAQGELGDVARTTRRSVASVASVLRRRGNAVPPRRFAPLS